MLDDADIGCPTGLPVVIVDSTPASDHPVVDADQAQGATAGHEHLLDLGHETVWHVAGRRVLLGRERERVWRATLEARRHRVPPTCSTATGRPSPGTGTARARRARRRHRGLRRQRPDGARHPARAARGRPRGARRRQHRRVRRHGGVGAFWPPLTTVHQDFAEVGRRASQSLLARSRRRALRPHLVPVRLVVRASTAAPLAERRSPAE